MGKFFKRKLPDKIEKKFIYIYTEGVKTETKYFQEKVKEIEASIRRKGIKVEIKGTGDNTMSLVDYAIKEIRKNKNFDSVLDECWVVFDKDDFVKDFDNAIARAVSKKIKVAYSNEAFELWYLLHFNFMSSSIKRSDYNKKITEYVKDLTKDPKYVYKKELSYNLIKDKELNAIQNAKRLLAIYGSGCSYSKKNPSTTVYLLVETLNSLK